MAARPAVRSDAPRPEFKLPLPERSVVEGTAFHYTSAPSFEAIVTTKTIFATEATRLNDMSEVTRGWKIVDSWLNDLDEGDEMVQVIRRYAPATRQEPSGVFILSATRLSDDAHQWRSYGEGGAGYVLAFDCTRDLKPAADPPPESDVRFHFESARARGWYRVMYDEQEVISALNELLAAARPLWEEFARPNESETFPARAMFGKGVFACLAGIAHLCKHPGFASEQEVRLVVIKPAPDHVRYRVGQQGLTAYVTLATAVEPDRTRLPIRPGTINLPPQAQLPVSQVTIGPCESLEVVGFRGSVSRRC